MSDQLFFDSKDLCNSVLLNIDNSLKVFSTELRVIENKMMNTDKVVERQHYKNMIKNLQILINTLKAKKEDIIVCRRIFDPSFIQQKDIHLGYKDTEPEDIAKTVEHLDSKFLRKV